MNVIYLLNKDLRLRDNKALVAAAQNSTYLSLVYCLDKDYQKLSSAQKYFIQESLADLKNALFKVDRTLYVWTGEMSELFKTVQDLNVVYISKVYNSREHEKFKEIEQELIKRNIEIHAVENSTLYKIQDLPFNLKDCPRIFTEFRKKIEKVALNLNTVEPLSKWPGSFDLKVDVFDEVKDWFLGEVKNTDFHGGESSGQKRVRHYLWGSDRAKTYKETRNGMLEFDDSTKFSPWLAVGALSAADVLQQLRCYEEEEGSNESTYWVYFELLWREYFKLYCLKHGESVFTLLGISNKKIHLSGDQEDLFLKWTEAETQNDFIDANMTELKRTGWMSNRGRQNVASYLSKHLGVDWRKGAVWFANQLLDYDVENNWGNWGYNAGVGADPRDRQFNIERQKSIYDPEGLYVEKFLGKPCG